MYKYHGLSDMVAFNLHETVPRSRPSSQAGSEIWDDWGNHPSDFDIWMWVKMEDR